MPDYYKAWDKLAAAIDDEEHEAVDTNKIQAEADRQFSQQEMMQRTSGARPNTEIVVKGARRSRLSIADEFKTQGNSYFVSLEYSKAIECYTRCLMSFDSKKDEPSLKTITLSNRAQSYIKLRAYPKAFEDADAAVRTDPTHVKSLGRRGTAAFYLRKFKVAQRDFLEVLRLDPQNEGFLDYLKKVDT